ncbi:MAG: hypothetical protein JWR35_301 [Marmoricola sp.]|jgi:hypothetical protein|nr:hypothetical protein [Marmoricola sp.]
MQLPLDMRVPTPTLTQRRRFYDGGRPAVGTDPGEPPNPAAEPQIVLTRVEHDGEESFRLGRRIAYDDIEFGELLVPRDLETWHTDLTSVPALFTWLVPKTGAHLPAALVHDGLIWNPAKETQSYTSTDGHTIVRFDADRVLRDAMRDTGTGAVRRWLVWSAVTAATMISGQGTGWTSLQRLRYRLPALLTILTVVYLGYCATSDLLDRHAWGAVGLPWMGDRSALLEIAGGLSGAVVIPLVLGLLWGRFVKAGWIVGITLAVLIHVTIALAAVTLLYQAVEWLVKKAPRLVFGLGALIGVVATVLFVGLTW